MQEGRIGGKLLVMRGFIHGGLLGYGHGAIAACTRGFFEVTHFALDFFNLAFERRDFIGLRDEHFAEILDLLILMGERFFDGSKFIGHRPALLMLCNQINVI